jgi:hypothetical protein
MRGARRVPRAPETEWEGFEPSRRVNPAHAISSRAPSAARTPLPGFPVSHGGARPRPRHGFSRCERFSATPAACAGRGGSRSFLLAPSASRSRLKLRRGTEAFRGNGTPAEWTNRRAFGHFVFGSAPLIGGGSECAYTGRSRFPAASGFFSSCGPCAAPIGTRTFLLAPGAESEADEAPPGCWKSLGTKARRRG